MDGKEETEELTWNRETVPKVLKIVSTRLSQKDLISLLLVSPWLYRTLVSYPSLWLIISLRETKNVGNRVMAALSLPRYRHVKEINLEFAKNIDDSHLEIIQNKCADSLQNLESLNLNACQSISDNGIKYITKVCPKLKVFNIYWNVRFADTGIEYLVKRCKHIIHLNLSGCKNISDKSLKLVSDNYPKLEFLNLTRCLKLTDSGLQLILRGCSSLQNLNLYALSGLSDVTYKNLSLLSHLKDLDLCGAQNLSDEGLSSIAKCKGLVSLNLTWCVRVTDAGIIAIAQGCPSLEYLSLYGIVGVTDKSLEALSTSCSHKLTTLDVNGCIGIKRRSRDELLKLFPNLKCFKVHS
ncbi:hypothetical protein UlMin_005086 [Ulmus minor]